LDLDPTLHFPKKGSFRIAEALSKYEND